MVLPEDFGRSGAQERAGENGPFQAAVGANGVEARVSAGFRRDAFAAIFGVAERNQSDGRRDPEPLEVAREQSGFAPTEWPVAEPAEIAAGDAPELRPAPQPAGRAAHFMIRERFIFPRAHAGPRTDGPAQP